MAADTLLQGSAWVRTLSDSALATYLSSMCAYRPWNNKIPPMPGSSGLGGDAPNLTSSHFGALGAAVDTVGQGGALGLGSSAAASPAGCHRSKRKLVTFTG